MKFIIHGDVIHNDVQTMAQVFYQNMGFVLVDKVPDEGLCLEVTNFNNIVSVRRFEDGRWLDCVQTAVSGDTKAVSRAVKFGIFRILRAKTGYRPPWGLLTGIRPAKIATTLYGLGFSEEETRAELLNHYLVDPRRAGLCIQAAGVQQGIIDANTKAISIYIGVPFCPSICQYCSFSSYPKEKFGKYMVDYVAALVKEIEFLGRVARGKFVENIYIGGGTPTVLTDGDFEKMLAAVSQNFETKSVLEYSVEAGRPDTITPTKLDLMKKYGVGRISINPQTLNNTTLAQIGRGHTAEDFFAAYEMAQQAGFEHINIDLILGLPGEGANDVKATLEGLRALSPKSVTVHTLAVKRASRLHQELDLLARHEVAEIEESLNLTADYMAAANLNPYYLYRQKNSLGNFENVGYSVRGREGRYNIQIMEERQSVYAAGAGAVTKLVKPGDTRIERIFNLCNPVDYIRKVDEMIERKVKGGIS